MVEEEDSVAGGTRRGPQFPFIGLEKAIEKTRQLYAKARRLEVRLTDAASDWGYGPRSSGAFRTAAALLAFGLIEDSGTGEARKIRVSDLGWRILDDQRPGIRGKLLAEAALKPRLIAEFYEIWKDGRPDDVHAISSLKFDYNFPSDSASRFIRVFDETAKFINSNSTTEHVIDSIGPMPSAGLKESHPPVEYSRVASDDQNNLAHSQFDMSGGIDATGRHAEREILSGFLSRETSFRLLIRGSLGAKEIDRLIKKLEIDREIFVDVEQRADENDSRN